MKTYLIEPKAPLVVRSGRPFDDQAGADAAKFPPPSTLAGTLRTAHAESCGKQLNRELSEIAVAGPLPVKLDMEGNPVGLLVPKPADAMYVWSADKQFRRLLRTQPSKMSEGEGCDLPQGLLPVQLAEKIKSKPAPGPRWWSWEDMLVFRNLNSGQALAFDQISSNGWSPMADDVRTHVGIERETQAAQAGKLFQTSGLNCWQRPQAGDKFPAGNIGVVGCIQGRIDQGLITLGGERRLSSIKSVDMWPALPESFAAGIQKAKGLTLTLLTPALFAEGWYPAWLNEELIGTPPGCEGLELRLRATAMERWQAHSGWDLAQNKPRAGRKLMPAGGVFWFEVLQADDAALNALWLIHISDHAQDRRDGFGLVLPQPWSPLTATPV